VKIAAIMPCRGRAEQTIRNVKRLLATAGNAEWRLTCIGGTQEADLLMACSRAGAHVRHIPDRDRLTYWQALDEETGLSDVTHFVNLANDLIPGMHWLSRAARAYEQLFYDGDGMIGFNGDSHEVGHSCHFLISRGLLERFGGWPVWYDHNFGDTELCERATAYGCYAKAPWAILFHDHPYFGGADDEVYAEGRRYVSKDERLFNERKRQGWPKI
jgi:hypothetical protein